MNCPSQDQKISQLTERAISLEKTKRIYSAPIYDAYLTHGRCCCLHCHHSYVHYEGLPTFEHVIYGEPRVSKIVQREPRVARVSVVRESVIQQRESVSPSRTYEKGRRIKQIRTSSPILNYDKRFDRNGVDRGPVIEGYETKVEDFEEPLEDENTVYKRVNQYLEESRPSHKQEDHSVRESNLREREGILNPKIKEGSDTESQVIRSSQNN